MESAKGDILVVDDELAARKSFRALLEGEGYSVRTARDGADALAKFSERRPDLVLLDVMMPRMNGTAACAEIRRLDPIVPILFFTAMPSDVGAVRALGFGADDYIEKSRPPEVLLARIAAALRRQAAANAPRRDVLRLGAVEVDLSGMAAKGPGVDVQLTRLEAQLLRLLSSERGRVFTYDEILSAVHGEGYVGEDSAVHTAVSRLKGKLGRAGALIATERGSGYRLVQ
jgi:DNA-binding response OmpR family regulator